MRKPPECLAGREEKRERKEERKEVRGDESKILEDHFIQK